MRSLWLEEAGDRMPMKLIHYAELAASERKATRAESELPEKLGCELKRQALHAEMKVKSCVEAASNLKWSYEQQAERRTSKQKKGRGSDSRK